MARKFISRPFYAGIPLSRNYNGRALFTCPLQNIYAASHGESAITEGALDSCCALIGWRLDPAGGKQYKKPNASKLSSLPVGGPRKSD